MAAGILIDDDGEPWPDRATALARRIGYDEAGDDLAGFAVAERGFIHVRPIEAGVRIALRPGAFTAVTLAGALQVLNDLAPRRILLVIGSGDERVAELFTSIFDFIERVEQLASDPAIEPKMPWLAVPRGLHNLRTAAFAQVRPLIEYWRRTRGAYGSELYDELIRAGLLHRAVLARQVLNSSRLICEHFGGKIGVRRPCQSLCAIGHGLEEMHDRDFGDWSAEAYAVALAGGRPRLESIRARVRVSEDMAVNGRYDRLVLPWSSTGGSLVLGISIRRELLTVS